MGYISNLYIFCRFHVWFTFVECRQVKKCCLLQSYYTYPLYAKTIPFCFFWEPYQDQGILRLGSDACTMLHWVYMSEEICKEDVKFLFLKETLFNSYFPDHRSVLDDRRSHSPHSIQLNSSRGSTGLRI